MNTETHHFNQKAPLIGGIYLVGATKCRAIRQPDTSHMNKLGYPPKWQLYIRANRVSRMADVPVDSSRVGKLNLPNFILNHNP